jgi:hypothetical protein
MQGAKGSLIPTDKMLSERFDLECLKIEHDSKEPLKANMSKREKI